ncbi:TolC family protein [Nitrospira sp. NS4]|uniref:TolC family protein n=1 Tax=Nitrospira sp. NS4 TaxID=3414498 RepID=UPI003C2FEC12
MRTRVSLSLVCLSAALWGAAFLSSPGLAQEPPPNIYTLDSILDLALARNPAVSSAEGLIDRQRGQQTAAGAYPNPSVTGYLGYGEIRDAGRAHVADTIERQSITEYNVTLGQPLEWPAMRAARQQVADAGLATANAGMSETRLNLTTQVKVAFYDLLLAQQDAALARQNLEIVESVARIVKARVKSGEGPQFESIKAEVEVLKARQQLSRADNAVRVNRVVVNTLTGGALESAYLVRGEFAGNMTDLQIEGLMARMATQHPTIQRLLKSVEQSDWKVEFERQSRIPSVTVNGSYWREIGREAVQGGLSVPLPLWYRKQGEIAASLGEKRREEAELLRTRNELARAIHQHYQDARTTADLIAVFDKGLLKQAQEALRLAQFSFQQGASSLLDVFDAQRVQRQIQMDYAQARYELSVSLARLERAVGGSL